MTSSELRFDGKSIIVTGAGRGVGRAHALLLAARGANVVVADNGSEMGGADASPHPAEDVAAEIRAAGGSAIACCASVAESPGANDIVSAAIERFGRLDAVINNAGSCDLANFTDTPLEHFQRMMAVHYFGTVNVLKAAWPHLKASGCGRVVNTISEGMAGMHAMITSQGGSQGGVLALTLTLATESKKDGILVNCIAPRAATRMTSPEIMHTLYGMPKEHSAAMAAKLPADLVSPVAAFLAHPSCQLNGVILAAGGGAVARLAVMENSGVSNVATIEDVAANLESAIDMTSAKILGLLTAA